MATGEIPVVRLQRLLHQLNITAEQSDWPTCAALARKVIATIRLAVSPESSQTGKPHLDGIYTVGTLRYIRAPADVQRLLNRMNRIIRTARQALR